MDSLTFEDKVALLVLARDKKAKAELINRWNNDKEFYIKFNSRQIPLEKYMELNAERFRPIAEKAAIARMNMKNRGWTDKKYQKYIGELPEPLFHERSEFSGTLPQNVLKKNIHDFLTKYPAFRVDK